MDIRDVIDGMIAIFVQIKNLDPDCLRWTLEPLPSTSAHAGTVLGHERALMIVNPFFFLIPDDEKEWTLDEVIAHEMIHVKQWCDGRLAVASDIESRDAVVIWEGSEYRETDPSDQSLPWEAEAYGRMRAEAKLMRFVASAKAELIRMGRVA